MRKAEGPQPLEEDVKRYWLELMSANPHIRAAGLRLEPKIPPKEAEVFDWENSLSQLVALLHTGRLPPEKEPPKERKQWKWEPKKQEGLAAGKWTPTPPVDFSSVGLSSFDSDRFVKPRVTKQPPQKDLKDLFVTNAVRFSQNQISSWCWFDNFMIARFADPAIIQWLDLSYNRISEIDPVLSMLPRLKTLYLHCNCLSDLDEVRNLRFMPCINILTLFGNPLETTVDYRLNIIAALPMLKRLDWGLVTPRERILAKVYVEKMLEKDAMEALEMKHAEEAARRKQDSAIRKAEKRRLKLEEERHKIQVIPDEEINEKQEETVEETLKEAESVSNELDVSESELEEEQSGKMTPALVPLDLADIGPLDVKGKHKRHPDSLPLTGSIGSCPSSTSFSSVDTVCLDDIRKEFQKLKELEANVMFKF